MSDNAIILSCPTLFILRPLTKGILVVRFYTFFITYNSIMATKQVYTPDVPAITAHSKFENLLVPGHSACVFVLPNFLCACPACGLISNTASGLEAHIKGKKDRSCCVEYSWKFGPWAKLELGKKEPSAKNTHPTPYPNIKWKTGNLGKNVTADELEESNAFNKKWLEDRNFPTSNSKINPRSILCHPHSRWHANFQKPCRICFSTMLTHFESWSVKIIRTFCNNAVPKFFLRFKKK